LRLSDARSALWRAMQAYHRVIVEDWQEQVGPARRLLRRAAVRLARAKADGVRYDQIPQQHQEVSVASMSHVRPADEAGGSDLS
jgi:hypothetical protein